MAPLRQVIESTIHDVDLNKDHRQMSSVENGRSEGFFRQRETIRRRQPGKRRAGGSARFRPSMDWLERRIALSTITWNVSRSPYGGDWDVAANWVGSKVPGPSDIAIIPKLQNGSEVFVNSGQADQVGGLQTDATVSLRVASGSLSFTAGSSTTFGGPVTIASTAAMNFADGASMTIDTGQTLSVDGALNLASRNRITMVPGAQQSARIIVGGSLTATSAIFASANDGISSIATRVTGRLFASSSTFGVSQVIINSNTMQDGDLVNNVFSEGTTLQIPDRWLKYLSKNASFHDVALSNTSLVSGTLSLDPIGTDISNLRYVLPSGYSIGKLAKLNIGRDVKVVLPAGQTLSVAGSMNLANGSQLLLDPEGVQPAQVVVDGTLSTSGGSILASTGDGSSLSIRSGGNLQASDGVINVDILSHADGSKAVLSGVTLGNEGDLGHITVDGSASVSLGNVVVSTGTLIDVGANAAVSVPAGKKLTVDGAFNLASGGRIVLDPEGTNAAHVFVNGNLSVNGGLIKGSQGDGSSLQINAGGNLEASNSDFSLSSIVLASGAASSLSGLLGGSGSNTRLTIDSDATVDLGGATIPAGSTLEIGPLATVVVDAGKVFTINGTLSFLRGGQVLLDASGTKAAQIIVNGSLLANGTWFVGSEGDGSAITVNSGGRLDSRNGVFAVSSLTLGSGSDATMIGNQLGDTDTNTRMTIHSNASIDITGNDFSRVADGGIIATGSPSAHINLVANYWGTTDPQSIDDRIQDHNDLRSRPTVDYAPLVVSGSRTSSQTSVNLSFSQTDQTITLHAKVTAPDGQPIQEGSERFSFWSKSRQLGDYSDWVSVEDGVATLTLSIPAGAQADSYNILVEYSGSENYLPSSDQSQVLTITPAATTISTGSAAVSFNSKADQAMSLEAAVSSEVGTVSDGIVTFTVLSDGSTVGTPVQATVVDGIARATFVVPAGTARGSYTIQAVYTDADGNLLDSTATGDLTVNPAATTVTSAGAQITYNSHDDAPITVTANVNSTAGTVNMGTVSYTVIAGSTPVGASQSFSVVNGVATGSFQVPSGLDAGTYVLRVIYNGADDYSTSLPVDYVLTVVAAATTTVVPATTVPYQPSSSSIRLAVRIAAGTLDVDSGTVTFTVLKGTVPIGTKTASVINGEAVANVPLDSGNGVGTYTYAASYVDASGNYLASGGQAALTIDKALPEITWATPADISYGTPISAAQLNATVAIDGVLTYTTAIGAVLPAGNAQALTLTFTPTDTANYANATATVYINVLKAESSFINLPSSQTITYGQSQLTVSGTLTSATAIPAGQGVTISVGPLSTTVIVQPDGSFSATFDTHALNASAAPYTIHYSYAGDANFQQLDDATTTLTVNRATPTINWATPDDIIYGTRLSTTQLNATASIPGAFNYTPALGTIVPGGQQSLSATFTPVDTTNYETVTTTVPLYVSPIVAHFSGISGSQAILYGQPSIFVSGTITSGSLIPRGQNVTISIGSARGTATVRGDGSFSTLVDTHTLSTSQYPYLITYELASDGSFESMLDASTTLTVSRATPTVIWSIPADITYGTWLSGAQLNATANVPGSFGYSRAPGTVLPVGYQTISVVFTPNDSVNYVATTASVPINVVPAAPVFQNLPQSRSISYGQPGLAVTARIAAGAAIPGGQTVTVSVGSITSTAVVRADGWFSAAIDSQSLNASPTSYQVRLSYAGDGSFQAVTDTSTTLTVNPASLIVSADSLKAEAGKPLPALTYSTYVPSGGNPSSSISGSLATTATSGSAPGDYPITQGTLSAGANYNLTFNPGRLTIENPAVRLTGVSLVRGRNRIVNAVILTFDVPLDRSTAMAVANYSLTAAGVTGGFEGRGSRAIPLRAINYSWNGTRARVVLTPRQAFTTNRRVQLQISGLRSTLGAGFQGNEGDRETQILDHQSN